MDRRSIYAPVSAACITQSTKGQLTGRIPLTIRGQQAQPEAKLDASHIHLADLGDFKDLENVKGRQRKALE